jgi:hypothetical protein
MPAVDPEGFRDPTDIHSDRKARVAAAIVALAFAVPVGMRIHEGLTPHTHQKNQIARFDGQNGPTDTGYREVTTEQTTYGG